MAQDKDSVLSSIGGEAYNTFKVFPKISYNCITMLMNQNEMVWKLLKYTDMDAWNKPDLSQEEKASLIYRGQEDSALFRVFMDSKPPDVLMDEVTLIRIMPTYAVGKNRTVGYIEVSMEVYSHFNINHISNYETRVDRIVAELFSVFNGALLPDGAIGRLSFDKMADQSSRLYDIGQIPFGGKQIVFSVNSAG